MNVETPAPPPPVADAPARRAKAAMQWAIWMLLLVYVAPLVLVAVDYGTTKFLEKTTIQEVFIGMASTPSDSYSLLHRSLLPLMAGFAPLAFGDEGSTRSSIGIMALLMLGIALTIFLSGLFNSLPARDALLASSLFDAPPGVSSKEATEAGLSNIKAFLNRTQEAMAMYLLMLFGLKLEKATR